MLTGSLMKIHIILKEKALERITALQKKHHLEQDDQFDPRVRRAVDHIVLTTIQGKTGREAGKKLQKQYKQPAQLFSKTVSVRV